METDLNTRALPLSSARLYWTCQVVGWGGYAITQSIAAALTLSLPWPTVLVEALLLHGTALVFSHGLRAYMVRSGSCYKCANCGTTSGCA